LLEIATSNELPITNEPSIISLDLEEIRRDGGTQPRAKIDLLHIKRLEEQIEDGQEIEAVVVFHDGENYWLADGFHRWHAHKNQEQPTITALVHQGSRREAVLYSVGANADHKPALPRSREDKRRSVMTLLNDPEWGQWSDREIARQCKVHHQLVGRLRSSLDDHPVTKSSSERTYKTKHGTIATMNTTKIGSSKVEQPIGSRVTVRGDRYFEGQSGTITQIPNSRQAIVELDSGERDLINLRHLVWEATDLSVAGEIIDNSSPTSESDMAQSPPFVPQKVEVNTNDILIAFKSNLDVMGYEQLKFVGKAIASLSPERVEAVVKAIASINPDIVARVLTKDNTASS
jgi:hypothetical protein